MNQKGLIWRVCSPSARQAFDEMRDQTPFLFPFLLVVLASLILMALVTYPTAYFLFENLFDSIKQERGVSYTGQYFEVGDTRIDTLHGFKLTPLIVISLVFEAIKICFFVGVRLILMGTYFYAVGRWLGIDYRWEHWFGLSCWANIPMIVVPTVVLLIGTLSMTQQPPDVVVGLLWFVFFFPPFLWSMFISVEGLRSWTEKDTAFCVRVALVPYVIIFLLLAPVIVGSFFDSPFFNSM